MNSGSQEKNNRMVKIILSSLAEYYKVKGYKGVADYLGIPVSKVYGWVRNGNIGDTGAILTKSPEINIKWLRTGSGSMLRGEKSKNIINQQHSSGSVANQGSVVHGNIRTGTRQTPQPLIISEVLEWLENMENQRPGYATWFSIELGNRFPEFEQWRREKAGENLKK